VVSAVLHSAVVAWLAHRSPAPRPSDSPAAQPAAAPIEILTVRRPETAPGTPIDVALLDEQPPVPAPTPAAATSVTRPPSPSAPAPAGSVPHVAAATATAGAPRPTEEPGAPAGHPPDRPSLLAMRHGEAPSTALPFGRWDSLDHAPRGTGPVPAPTSGLLHDAGGGSYRSEQGGFDVTVQPDGAATLRDRPSLQAHIAVPTPHDVARSVARWILSDKGQYGQDGDTSLARQVQVSSKATSAVEGPNTTWAPEKGKTVIVPVVSGSVDVSDWLMRRHGQDPYAARKLATLDATRDERVAIGKRHRAAELARATDTVLRQLEALWASPVDLAERKQGLFELWDDCAESGDPEVVAAADAARRLIIDFIRAHLPAGSADAYTPAELAALARTRSSQAAFTPYD
jgi:hypothetical protein